MGRASEGARLARYWTEAKGSKDQRLAEQRGLGECQYRP